MNAALRVSVAAVALTVAALSTHGGEHFKPGGWLGIQVGRSSLAAARQRLGAPQYSGPAYEETESQESGREINESYLIDRPLPGRLNVYASRRSSVISAMDFAPSDQGLHLSDMERLLDAKLVERQYEWCPSPGFDTGGSWYMVPSPAGNIIVYEDLSKGLRVVLSLQGTVGIVEFLGKPPATKCPPVHAPPQSRSHEGLR
jgi:hypothetical protein